MRSQVGSEQKVGTTRGEKPGIPRHPGIRGIDATTNPDRNGITSVDTTLAGWKLFPIGEPSPAQTKRKS